MRWYHYLSYLFGGAFLCNAIPHLVCGVSGRAFQTPFSSPPGVGLSSAMVNVYWGFFNLLVGYLLVWRVGDFGMRKNRQVLAVGAGFFLMAIGCAKTFARFYGG